MNTDIRKRIALFVFAALTIAAFAGCNNGSGSRAGNIPTLEDGIKFEEVNVSEKTLLQSTSQSAHMLAVPAATATMKTEFTARDKDVGYERSDATVIELEGTTAKISGEGAFASGGNLTITAEGSYVISGTLEDGTIFIDVGSKDKVQLVLDGADISCSDFAAIFVKKADKVFITLADNSVNSLSDGVLYKLTKENSVVDGIQRNVDAVVFCRSDVSINGTGKLTVTGSYKHAIVSKDDLIITGGIINVSAPKGGLYGRHSVRIGGGAISVTSGSDGIRADNNTEPHRGFIYINGGDMLISAGSDGIQAATALIIDGGTTMVSAVRHPIKCGTVAIINGGALAALGSEFNCPVGETSAQRNVLFAFGSPAGIDSSLAVAKAEDDLSFATFTALRPASVLFLTFPEILPDTEYALYIG